MAHSAHQVSRRMAILRSSLRARATAQARVRARARALCRRRRILLCSTAVFRRHRRVVHAGATRQSITTRALRAVARLNSLRPGERNHATQGTADEPSRLRASSSSEVRLTGIVDDDIVQSARGLGSSSLHHHGPRSSVEEEPSENPQIGRVCPPINSSRPSLHERSSRRCCMPRRPMRQKRGQEKVWTRIQT